MLRSRFVFLAACLLADPAIADDSKTVGRVRVTTVHVAGEANAASVSAALAARHERIISVRPRPDDPTRFDATIYDATKEMAFDLVLDANGKELQRKALAGQPARTLEELDDASTIVREYAAFAEALAGGALRIYEPMPAITVDAEGRRLVNVGVISQASNEIVSVHIPTASVVRYGSGAPPTSSAALLACGPPNTSCSYSTGPCATYQVSWPAANPVWKLNVRHPNCTTSVQSDGTGLELTNVYYKGRMILKRAEVPVLNVKYANDTCGPYRDWLYAEDCFQATGTDVPSSGSGVRIANAPPSTLCESGSPGSDAGNFRGLAIYDQGDSLWILSETNAGWYRYVMEWRLHLDGTMEPIFGFGAVSNSCTCNAHFHHAYWRMEWAVDAVSNGTTDDPATGIVTLERRRQGTQNDYDPIASEGTFLRPATNWDQDYWRIVNPLTGNGYVLQPGELDGHANGDPYAKWDLAALALNSGQINDSNSDTSINIAPWVSGEALGAAKRLVTWYHVTYAHDDPGGSGEACEISGPKFVPLTTTCAGSVSLDKNAFTCNSSVSVTMFDTDLAGQGTAALSVTSGTEGVAEPLVLTASPAGSGRFQGSINTVAGAAVHGDGKISVAHGDTIDIRYLDASSCGAPNVAVHTTASIDCVPPSITNVSAVAGTTQATIGWNTSEAASTVVHYGTSVPTGSSGGAAGMATAHAATINGLSECTTYFYWVESADAAGNTVASNSGGGYFAFTTPQAHVSSLVSNTPVPIPDNLPAGATSTIAVADPAVVQDVNVTVNISHTYDRDLTLSLITPANTPITLALARGGSSNNFTSTVFDDEAASSITSGSAPFTGSFRPEQPLSAADGLSSAGNWKFKVVDAAAQDTGTINNWTLKLTYPNVACAPAGTPPPVPDGTFGTEMKASRIAGSGVHLIWDVATCSAENYHLLYGTLQNVASYAPTGAVCGLGPLGGYDWAGVQAGNLWFLIVADDAAAKEGTWGTNGAGAHRRGTVASGLCGFTTRSNAGSCP